MSMVVLALLAISLAGTSQQTEPAVPPSLLERLVGKPATALQGLDAAPLCPGSENSFSVPAPLYVWKITRQNRFVVFCLARMRTNRSGGAASIHLFDATGKRVAAWPFRTGNRLKLASAALVYSDSLRTDLIVFESTPVIDPQRAKRQYFAITADRLHFIRAEDDSGEMLPNVDSWPLETMGIVPEAKTADEWIALLQSENRVDVLAALVVIGGQHVDKDPELIKMVGELRQNAQVRVLIERLRESDNAWIRQTAELAARQ